MPSESEHVYCYQFGTGDCYKVGRTKHQPEKRKRGFATGSPVKFKLYRDVRSENAPDLERYIHQLLAVKRAPNGEFFDVTPQELDEAVDRAVSFVREFEELFGQANELRKKKPCETVVEPSVEMREIHRQLIEAKSAKSLLEWRIGLLESKIQVKIGDGCGMRGVASWEWVDRWTMDTEQFKNDPLYEMLFEKYKRDSSYRRFCPEINPLGDLPAEALTNAEKRQREGTKSLAEVFAMVRGLADDVDFSRNPSTGRPVDLP